MVYLNNEELVSVKKEEDFYVLLYSNLQDMLLKVKKQKKKKVK